MEHTAYLSIGSNIGDAESNCIKSVETLRTSDYLKVISVSHYYKSEPVDFLDQGYFVNLALKLKSDLSPHDLLQTLKRIQEAMGQGTKEIRFGPRIIDLDIIFYDNLIIGTADLKIPHPRMHLRNFVLKPLCDIASDFKHPVIKLSVKEMLEQLNEENQECLQIK